MGCLIALKWASQNADKIETMILMGLILSPLPETRAKNNIARAGNVRDKGRGTVVDGIIANRTSHETQKEHPVSVTAVRLMMMTSQTAEAYAKARMASADSTKDTVEIEGVKGKPMLLLTGVQDATEPEAVCEAWKAKLGETAAVSLMDGLGHLRLLEDFGSVNKEIAAFLV